MFHHGHRVCLSERTKFAFLSKPDTKFALHSAARNGDETRIMWLLSMPDTDVNEVNDDGLTALEIAKQYGFEKCVARLTSHMTR